MLRYSVNDTVVTVYHKDGELVLTDAVVVGSMITGTLNGLVIDISTYISNDGFYYGIYRDGNKLQLAGA